MKARFGIRILCTLLAVSFAVTSVTAQESSVLQRYRSARQRVTGGVMKMRPDSLSMEADSAAAARDSLEGILRTAVAAARLNGMLADSVAAADSTAIRAAVPDSAALALLRIAADSLAAGGTVPDSMAHAVAGAYASGEFGRLPATMLAGTEIPDSLAAAAVREIAAGDSLFVAVSDSLAGMEPERSVLLRDTTGTAERQRRGSWIMPDSMSLSKVCWISAVLPGYGQIYNKQYWKLPVLYGLVGTSLGLFIHENNRYQPMRREYESLTDGSLVRTEHLNSLQTRMIKSNTRRQIYLGTMLASYIYFIGDAAVNYSTNDVSHVKKATTLSTICPGAGQIYNRSYWKVPFVVGGFASMIYCIDWNNRGYKRFQKAYNLLADYEAHPDNYPDGPTDEFHGRYSTSFLKNLKDSYRRNRDLCIIITAGIYILQIIDAHVDAHLQDYDISDDLSFNIEPMVDYNYVPAAGGNRAMYGFNISLNF